MARIGTVIREVYHRPGADALPAHLEDHYGIRVTGTAKLTEGVFRVDHDAGPPWVARVFLAGLLHSAGPRHAGAALAGYREHTELTSGELDRLEGVLWIRILWLSAWQCWLACVSAKVHQGFYPRREYITALAAAVRAHSGRPA